MDLPRDSRPGDLYGFSAYHAAIAEIRTISALLKHEAAGPPTRWADVLVEAEERLRNITVPSVESVSPMYPHAPEIPDRLLTEASELTKITAALGHESKDRSRIRKAGGRLRKLANQAEAWS